MRHLRFGNRSLLKAPAVSLDVVTVTLVIASAALLASAMGLARPQAAPSAQAVVDELLGTDRQFASSGSKSTAIEALTAMFSANVIVTLPPGQLVRGLENVRTALGGTPDKVTGRIEWAPIRGGISADGTHGFTFGFMTLHVSNGTTISLKYMAYWVKGEQGWRVAGYKRARRAEGNVSLAMLPPHLPLRLVPPTRDGAAIESHRRSLAAAEQAFSDEAQTIGLEAAFTKYGTTDAVNMGGPGSAGYVVGAEAIGRSVGGGRPKEPSPVYWSTETALVASSGDLGISFGYIRPNRKGPDGAAPPGQPFFTIWYRSSPDSPWRYIAE